MPSFPDLRKKVQHFTKLMESIHKNLCESEFELECENEDYLMILKKIELIEQMK